MALLRVFLCAVSTVALLAQLVVAVAPSPAYALFYEDNHVESQFFFEGDSHFEFGLQLGKRFALQIQQRLQRNTKLQTLLLPFHTTQDGKALYTQYLDTHVATFPDYVDELRGIAEGSGVPFETIFMMNLIEEFEDSIPASFHPKAPSAARQHVLRCSDIVLTAPHLRAVAHNEDGSAEDVNRTAIITAKIGGNPKFVAYTYLGDLPSGAFGFNENGVAFTLNFVQPADTFVGGLGRGFVSRDLLYAANATDAIARITRPKQATGHNFQLMDVNNQRVWNIEVASFERHVIYEYVPQNGASPSNTNTGEANIEAFFHANQYQRLDIAQPPYDSSLHRLKRYSELPPPTNVREALAILGDQEDRSWPVFHDALSHERGELSGWTMTTVVFDVLEGRAYSFRRNPKLMSVKFIWDLKTLKVTPDSADQVNEHRRAAAVESAGELVAPTTNEMKAPPPHQQQGSATEGADDDALESAVWHEKHGMQAQQDKDIRTSVIDGLLCCLRSRCLGGTCIVFPCVLFLFVWLCLPTSKVVLRRAMLITSAVPPTIYILLGILLLCLVCVRQIQTDTENAQQAHQYVATRAKLTKIAVTSGDKNSDAIPGRFAMSIAAAKDGNVFNFQWCFDNQQEPDQVDHLGRSALHWAALSGADEIVTLLLRNGASIDLPDKLEGLTPLHYAAYYGNIKITRLLVNAGVSLTALDNRKMNPLQVAEMASLKLMSVQPSHQMIIKFLRIAMKGDVTPPLEHITGLTVTNLVERQIKALPQVQ